MSALKDIREGLAVNAATCTGVTVAYSRHPGTISATPAVVVFPQRFAVDTFEAGAAYRFIVQILVQVGDFDAAQDRLDDLLELDGALIEAVESDQTLGGAAGSVSVVEVGDYGLVDGFMSASLTVEVLA